jgi:phosphoserine phosphatase
MAERPPTLRLLDTPAARAFLLRVGLPFIAEMVADRQRLTVSRSVTRTPTLDQALMEAGCDWGWCPPETTFAGVRLFVTDMDSTLITIECIDEIAAAVGKRTEVAALTEAAMAGELDFRTALTARVALLAGLPEQELAAIYRDRVRYTPGAQALVAALKAQGAYCLLVSGGFTHFTAPIAAELGFDEHQANRLEVDAAGRLTGRVVGPIVDAQAKRAALLAAQKRLALPREAVLAAGDGANDQPMLGEAGLRLGYRPKAVLLPTLNLVAQEGLLLPRYLCD